MSSKRAALSPPRFLVLCLTLVALLCSPLIVSYRYLALHGETLSPKEVVDRLEQEPGAYYRSVMHDNLRETALEVLRRRQPEVMALGSSLTFDFREEYFSSSFACAGGVMDTLADGDQFVTEMLKVAQPKVVLFVLNFWWFTDTQMPNRVPITESDEAPRLSFSQLRQPYKQLSAKQITVGQLFGWQPLPRSGVVTNMPVGLMAEMDNVGRRADGSQLNGLVFSERAKEFYAPVRQRFAKIDDYVLQPGRFGPDQQILPERLELLRAMIKRMEAKGCRVVLLNPPMATPLVAAMRKSGRHAYYFEFGTTVAKLGAEVHDFHDPLQWGIPLAEFADTHHAGNTAYMRLLLEIARRHPASPLTSRIRQAELAQWVQKFTNTTVAVLGADQIRGRETDFLELGVEKPAP